MHPGFRSKHRIRTALIPVALACAWAGPAAAEETWKCPDGRYTLSGDSMDRDHPALSYKVVQDDDLGVVAVAPDNSGDYVGMAGILLRKSDGTLMRFGHAISAGPSSKPAPIGGSRVEHCHRVHED
jgi:hypothetical protein